MLVKNEFHIPNNKGKILKLREISNLTLEKELAVVNDKDS